MLKKKVTWDTCIPHVSFKKTITTQWWTYWDFPGGSDGKESACNAGDPSLILGSGRSPGEGNGNQLQYSCLENPMDRGAWRATVFTVKPVFQSPLFAWDRPQIVEKAMAPHSSTLTWKIPWMEEPGKLQSMGSLRVGHNWATSLSLFTFMHWRNKWQPTQCSCLENPRDGEAWWAAVSRVAQSRTLILSDT